MSKPLIHAESSVRKFGGVLDDYLPIHNMMDSSKSAMADVRHRAVFHSAFGIFVVEKIFGDYFINSHGKRVSVRDVAEQHVMEDLGFIPTLEMWLGNAPIQEWMAGKRRKSDTGPINTTKISFDDPRIVHTDKQINDPPLDKIFID